jgi:hypothetical protein
MYILEGIRDYRKENGINLNIIWNDIKSHNCFLHSLAMSHRKNIYHTEGYNLEDFKEVVCMSRYDGNIRDSIRNLIFNVLNSSPEHKKILLECKEFCGADSVNNGVIYLTIRGR